MSADYREQVTLALHELWLAVNGLKDQVRTETAGDMWPDTERLTFQPIEDALGKAQEAIKSLAAA